MVSSRAGRAARLVGVLALAGALMLFAASCTEQGKAKVKAAASSIAGGGLTPTHLPAPSESPTETAAPIPSESEATESPSPRPTRTRTPGQSPSEVETTEPPTTEPPTTPPTTEPSFSPSPVESSPSESPTETPSATESAAAENTGNSAWWVVLAIVVVGGLIGLALWMRARGQRASAWRTRARDPFSEGVVLHDRLKADLTAPQVADDRLDESLAEVDRLGQQLNALTVDAPDDPTRQALAALLMSLGAVRSALEGIRQAPDELSRQAAMEPARARVTESERSLGSFRAAVWPDSAPSPSS